MADQSNLSDVVMEDAVDVAIIRRVFVIENSSVQADEIEEEE